MEDSPTATGKGESQGWPPGKIGGGGTVGVVSSHEGFSGENISLNKEITHGNRRMAKIKSQCPRSKSSRET